MKLKKEDTAGADAEAERKSKSRTWQDFISFHLVKGCGLLPSEPNSSVAAWRVETIEACSNKKLSIDPSLVATMRSGGDVGSFRLNFVVPSLGRS
jgi:hypothetical protein